MVTHCIIEKVDGKTVHSRIQKSVDFSEIIDYRPFKYSLSLLIVCLKIDQSILYTKFSLIALEL